MHPAPGLGDLMPGWFAVPQDPITMAQQGVTMTPGIGDILPGSWVVPQNPILDFVKGQVKMIGQGQGKGYGNVQSKNAQVNGQGVSGLGCGGSCGGGCGCDDCGGGGGLGQVDFSSSLTAIGSDISAGNWSNVPADIGTMLQSQTVLGVPLWGALIAGYFLWDMLTSHKVQVSHR
jgi:hypothetical protein